MRFSLLKKNGFMARNIWKFSRRSVAILEHIRNSTRYKLYIDGSSESPLSNRGNGIAELILTVKILNFEKIDFCAKIYENCLEEQQ